LKRAIATEYFASDGYQLGVWWKYKVVVVGPGLDILASRPEE
jgi:hypothetical protein